MDEKTARTKWCPHVAHYNIIGLSIIAGKQDFHTNNFCIASDCMLWKPWRNPDTQELDGGDCGMKEGV